MAFDGKDLSVLGCCKVSVQTNRRSGVDDVDVTWPRGHFRGAF